MAKNSGVSFDGKFYSNIEKQAKNLPREFRAEFFRRTRNPIRNLRRRVNKVPSKLPGHPFIWSRSKAKQKAARGWWFAAIAGKIPGVRIPTAGGRYKRQGSKVEIEFNRTERTISSSTLESGFGLYTVGPRQVPSHKATGWPQVDEELEKAEVEFLDNAIAVWIDLTDKATGE